MRDILAVTRALGDENRIRILMLLDGQELCVCQILEVFALAPSTVSKHLSVLYSAGLIDSRKAGRWVYYRLAGQGAPRDVQNVLGWITASAQADPQIQADRIRLNEIMRLEPEALCKQQAAR